MAYEKIHVDELILRDRLALDRTHLANERTLLAYVRTAFMLIAAGATAIKAFGDDRTLVASGWSLLACGVAMAAFGAWRFIAVRRRIREDAITVAICDAGP
jgi:putative membrane protein